MTEEQAVEALTQRWITAFDALNPIDDIGVVPYCFDGETTGTSDYWARVTIRHNVRQQITAGGIGTRKFENRGTIFVQLFADVDQGRKQITKLIDAARSVFEGQRVSVPGDDEPVTVRAGTAPQVDTDGRWLSATIAFGFDWYQTR